MTAIIKSPLIAEDFIMLWPAKPTIPLRVEEEQPAVEDFVAESASISELPALEQDVGTPSENFVIENEAESSSQTSQQAQQERIKELEENAMQEGYTKGFAQGELEAQQQYAEILSQMQDLVDACRASITSVVKDSETLMGSIVFEAVSKIVGNALSTTDGCKQVIAQVIRDKTTADILVVKVSPRDFESLHEYGKLLGNDAPDSKTQFSALPLEADSSIELGGCIAELKDGRIDGRIETQFRVFAQSIKDIVNHR
jgi:flagellar assembly protein FliH